MSSVSSYWSAYLLEMILIHFQNMQGSYRRLGLYEYL